MMLMISPGALLRATAAHAQYLSATRPSHGLSDEPSRPALRMHRPPREPTAESWISLVLRDVQFWVPVVVLAAGLVVLRWIS